MSMSRIGLIGIMRKIEKDKFICIAKKGNVGTFVYVPSNPGSIALNATVKKKD